MGAEVIIQLVYAGIAGAMKLWEYGRQVYGKDAIPSWEEIMEKNKSLQAKIDAEK